MIVEDVESIVTIMATIIVVSTAASVTCSRWATVITLDHVVRLTLDLPVTITDQWGGMDHPVLRNSSVAAKEVTIMDRWDVTDHRIFTVEAPEDVLSGHVVVK